MIQKYWVIFVIRNEMIWKEYLVPRSNLTRQLKSYKRTKSSSV